MPETKEPKKLNRHVVMNPDKTGIEKLWKKHCYTNVAGHELMRKVNFLAAISKAEGELYRALDESSDALCAMLANAPDCDHDARAAIAKIEALLPAPPKEKPW